jgi:hypothetical protein
LIGHLGIHAAKGRFFTPPFSRPVGQAPVVSLMIANPITGTRSPVQASMKPSQSFDRTVDHLPRPIDLDPGDKRQGCDLELNIT